MDSAAERSPTPSDVFREYAGHEAERRSPLMVGLLEGAADDWDAGGVTSAVLAPYAEDPPGSAVPLRFAAALHRLVLTGQADELAAHYATVGGTAPADQAWPAARRVLERRTAEVRELTGLPCQTNEVGRAVPLLRGLVEVARRTGAPLRVLEIGASAGLNLLLARQLRPAADHGAVPVVWHSIVRTYVDPAEWQDVEDLTKQNGVWRLSYEPDPGSNPRGVPLRLHGPGTDPAGEVLAYGTGHGPPLFPAAA